MRLVPVTRLQTNAFIRQHHRHHRPVVGYRWAIGAEEGDKLVGVIVIGRPVAGNRMRNGGRLVAEVTRLATDGTKNACSFLYSAAARSAQAMGYDAIQTYILATEHGVSLRASGWRLDGLVDGQPRHERQQGLLVGVVSANDYPTSDKQRWVKALRDSAPSNLGRAGSAAAEQSPQDASGPPAVAPAPEPRPQDGPTPA